MVDPNEIAASVVSELNAPLDPGNWPDFDFTAVRTYVPIYQLEGLSDLVVSVAPRKERRVRSTRKGRRVAVTIEVGVMRLLTRGTPELDELSELVRYMAQYFGDHPHLQFQPTAVVLDPIERELYDDELLVKNNQFASVLRLLIEESE